LRKHRGVSAAAARERAIALLRDVGVPDPERRARAYAHELSVGMAQRVMLAAALSADPDLLIADEPTTALDVTVQAQILRLLDAERRKRNMAVLLISHDLTVVAAVASRVAVMYAGRIVEEGPTVTLIQAPRHPYTRRLFAAAELDPGSRPSQEAAIGDFGSTVAVARGCRYLPRCQVAMPAGLAATCASDEPSLLPFGAGAAVRCWASQPR
jgi:peptide/nickel transport system ATP-binding protein